MAQMGASQFRENLMDKATMAVFRLLAGGLKKKTAHEQYAQNEAAWKEKGTDSFVENQPQLTWLLYGTANKLERKLFFHGRDLTAAENSCEVIATYNALLALERAAGAGKKHKHRTLPELLYLFSKKGICYKGIFGTDPKALERFFREHNFRTAGCRGKQITEERLAEYEKDYDAFIMTAFNEGQNPFSMVHTMCISKEKQGYCRHNDSVRLKYYEHLYDAVTDYRGGRGHAFCVLAIGNR